MLWRALYDAGVYVNVAIYPAVQRGGALLRTSVMATHEREHLDRALEAFEQVQQNVPEPPTRSARLGSEAGAGGALGARLLPPGERSVGSDAAWARLARCARRAPAGRAGSAEPRGRSLVTRSKSRTSSARALATR